MTVITLVTGTRIYLKSTFSVNESLRESSDDSTKDLNRYEFLVKRYGHEADRKTITAISLEDAEEPETDDSDLPVTGGDH